MCFLAIITNSNHVWLQDHCKWTKRKKNSIWKTKNNFKLRNFQHITDESLTGLRQNLHVVYLAFVNKYLLFRSQGNIFRNNILLYYCGIFFILDGTIGYRLRYAGILFFSDTNQYKYWNWRTVTNRSRISNRVTVNILFFTLWTSCKNHQMNRSSKTTFVYFWIDGVVKNSFTHKSSSWSVDTQCITLITTPTCTTCIS